MPVACKRGVKSLSDLPCQDADRRYRVVVETPRGSRFKLRYDSSIGAFELERPLRRGLSYPFDWGFFPSTCADDGDPLDAMVIFETGTCPGVVVPSLPVGVLRVVQREEKKRKLVRNDRVMVVPAVRGVPNDDVTVDRQLRHELEAFFVAAGEHSGKVITIDGWAGPRAARACIARAARAYAAREHGAHPAEAKARS
jgi:inorganic pyrophosphatase